MAMLTGREGKKRRFEESAIGKKDVAMRGKFARLEASNADLKRMLGDAR